MSARVTLATAAAGAALAAAAGCGFGPGETTEGDAELRVTRDYGSEVLAETTVADPTESDTVMRALDRETDIDTRYGGAFVQSIEGLEGGVSDGRSSDWFFYVNGIESPSGAADVPMKAGDRIWWDYRDWTEAMRVPAVVGSFPEPFAQGSAEDPVPVRVECAGSPQPCDTAAERLGDEGVDVTQAKLGERGPAAMRVLVGPWNAVSADPTAALIAGGPGESGVFATFGNGQSPPLELLDVDGGRAEDLGAAGLVAALHPAEEPPVWVVTGTGPDEVKGAVAALDADDLRDRYAVALSRGETIPAPSTSDGVKG